MAPARTSPQLVIRSHEPPGPRTYSAKPLWDSGDPSTTVEGDVAIRVGGVTLGPVPVQATETLFRGGSNNPAFVDQFLAYRAPAAKVTKLGPGEKALVVVRFGESASPATFNAQWNRQDVTARFAVVPGRFAAVQLDRAPGRNVLVLSVSGTKPSGGTATDSDCLIWEAP